MLTIENTIKNDQNTVEHPICKGESSDINKVWTRYLRIRL